MYSFLGGGASPSLPNPPNNWSVRSVKKEVNFRGSVSCFVNMWGVWQLLDGFRVTAERWRQHRKTDYLTPFL